MARNRRARTRQGLNMAVAAIFLAGLWLPLMGAFFGWGRAQEVGENRPLAAAPRLTSMELDSLISYTSRFRQFFREHFGFRGPLISLQSYAKLKLLNVSSSPKVILGQDGWLFFAGDRSLENFTRRTPFSSQELERWARAIEARGEWLGERGIRYAFMVAPAKETIYPQYMPRHVAREDGSSRLDQLSARLKSGPSLIYVDLRPSLVRARERERIYHLTDSHWNDRGVYAAYRAILEAGVFPSHHARERSSFEETVEISRGGDLAAMLALADVLREQRLNLVPPVALVMSEGGRFESSTQGPKGPRVIIAGDSFLDALLPFLAEHAGHGLRVGNGDLTPALVERERPDLVIEEFAERRLMLDVPDDWRR